MLDLIAEQFPRLIEALRRGQRIRRIDAAALILAARYGERATAWTAEDCGRARQLIRGAFIGRTFNRRVRLQMEG